MAAPYNPLMGPMPSLQQIQNQATTQARNDVNAQLSALPNDSFFTNSANQLSNTLRGISDRLGQYGNAAGSLYQNAYNQGAAPGNAAIIAAGGTPSGANPNSGKLLAALGAMMGQTLGAGSQAAVARGRNDVIGNEKQASAIKQQRGSLYDKYVQNLMDNAFKVAQSRLNNSLALDSLGVNQGKLSVAQQNAQTAAQRAAYYGYGVSSAAGGRLSKADRNYAAAKSEAEKFYAQNSKPTYMGSTTPSIPALTPDVLYDRIYKMMLHTYGLDANTANNIAWGLTGFEPPQNPNAMAGH